MAVVALRGRPPFAPSGQELIALGFFGSLRPGCSMGGSPGCWIFTNIVFPSGVHVSPVISQPMGPVKNRRMSPVVGSAASIWLLPMFFQSGWAIFLADESVWIQRTPR